uniref:Large ribosomal subunit protein bL9m n=1 Tax=Meloidogyne incognita TaxID=6306 RepID=A0A914M2K1_MELIC
MLKRCVLEHRFISLAFSRLNRKQQNRFLWKFTHVYMPERTPDGLLQRPPTDHQDFTKYEAIEDKQYQEPAPPIKMILLEDVDDVGDKFEILELSDNLAHKLYLTKKAAYASPFDLEYYGKKKEEFLAQKDTKIAKMPRDLAKIASKISSTIVPIYVSIRNDWVLNPLILATSMEQHGIRIPVKCLHLAGGEPMKGPDLKEDGRLIRFYATIEDKLIVPLLGRILHVSLDEDTNLFPEDQQLKTANNAQLLQFGLRPETIYFNPNGLQQIFEKEEIGSFMAKRPSNAITGAE